MEWYIGVLKKYVEFGGRARRKEYWMFVLINMLIAIALGMVDGVFQAISDTNVSPLGSLYSLAVLLPSVGVAVRRLHDTNRSGWWYFIVLIPIVGWILLIVWLAKEGDQGSNLYGADPKAYEAGQAPVGYAPMPVPPQPITPQPVAPPLPPLPTAPTPAPAPVPTPATVPASWVADPSGRHEFRYWDGGAWTSHVSDHGVTSVDPI